MGKKTRGRLKIKMEYISDKLKRYTTFSKRRSGIMKKAYELSTLTGTEVLLLVASETGHVYTYATDRLKPIFTSDIGRQLIQQCLGADASANVATNEVVSRSNLAQPNEQMSSDEDDDDDSEDSEVEEVVMSAGSSSNPAHLLQSSIQQHQISAPPPLVHQQRKQSPVRKSPQQNASRKTAATNRKSAPTNSRGEPVKVEPMFGATSHPQAMVLDTGGGSIEPSTKRRASFQIAAGPSSSTSVTSPGALLATANGHLYFVNDGTQADRTHPPVPDNHNVASALQKAVAGNHSRRVLPGSFVQNGHLAASSAHHHHHPTGMSVYEQSLFISTGDPIMHNQPHLSQRTNPQLPSHSSVSSNSSSDNNNSRTFSK